MNEKAKNKIGFSCNREIELKIESISFTQKSFGSFEEIQYK